MRLNEEWIRISQNIPADVKGPNENTNCSMIVETEFNSDFSEYKRWSKKTKMKIQTALWLVKLSLVTPFAYLPDADISFLQHSVSLNRRHLSNTFLIQIYSAETLKNQKVVNSLVCIYKVTCSQNRVVNPCQTPPPPVPRTFPLLWGNFVVSRPQAVLLFWFSLVIKCVVSCFVIDILFLTLKRFLIQIK